MNKNKITADEAIAAIALVRRFFMQHHTQEVSNDRKELEHNKKVNERYNVAEQLTKMIHEQKEFQK